MQRLLKPALALLLLLVLAAPAAWGLEPVKKYPTLSSSATGLTYTAATGVISLTPNYGIPTATQISNWNTAYGWGLTNGLLKIDGAYGASAAVAGVDYLAPNGTNLPMIFPFGAASIATPVKNTTYWIGSDPSNSAGSASGLRTILFPTAGTLKEIAVQFRQTPGASTAEPSSLFMRITHINWSGTDEAMFAGDSAASAGHEYEIEIDGNGTPDTFKWRKDGGAYTTGVAVAASVNLADGISVTFASTTGHTIGNKKKIKDKTVLSANIITNKSTSRYISAALDETVLQSGWLQSWGEFYLITGNWTIAPTSLAVLQSSLNFLTD